MTIISVDRKQLAHEFQAWRVPQAYGQAFANKNTDKAGRVALHPFFFNDTEHMTSPRHWLAVNTAFWCCAYREAQSRCQQVEALAGIRAMFFTAGALGVGEITAMIQEWWKHTYQLHAVPAPNYSAAITQPTFH